MAFDLDGTLYDEWDYVSAAYRAFCERNVPEEARDEAYRYLKDEFEGGRRRGVFGGLTERFPVAVDLDGFLEVLRTVRVDGLSLYEGASDLIRSLLDDGIAVSIVTNGNPRQQRNKIDQMGWGDLGDRVVLVLANELMPKPAPDGMLRAMKLVGSSHNESVLVGDSNSDESCALGAGATFVHVAELAGP